MGVTKSYLFSIVCSQLVHFHFSKTSSPKEKGTKSPSLQTGHFGKILGNPPPPLFRLSQKNLKF